MLFDPPVLHLPPAGECSEECGTGEAARPLTCVSKTYSLPVTLDNCNYNITDIQALEGGCGLGAPCPQTVTSGLSCSQSRRVPYMS